MLAMLQNSINDWQVTGQWTSRIDDLYSSGKTTNLGPGKLLLYIGPQGRPKAYPATQNASQKSLGEK